MENLTMLSCPICLESVFLGGVERIDLVCPPCGHVFHQNCLSVWMLGNNSCPKCRVVCEFEALRRLYFNVAEGTELDAADPLVLAAQLREKLEENTSLTQKLATACTEASQNKEQINHWMREHRLQQDYIEEFRKEINELKKDYEESQTLLQEKTRALEAATGKIEHLSKVRDLVELNKTESEATVENSSSQTLKMAVYHFKREAKRLMNLCVEKDNLIRDLDKETRDIKDKLKKMAQDMQYKQRLITDWTTKAAAKKSSSREGPGAQLKTEATVGKTPMPVAGTSGGSSATDDGQTEPEGAAGDDSQAGGPEDQYDEYESEDDSPPLLPYYMAPKTPWRKRRSHRIMSARRKLQKPNPVWD